MNKEELIAKKANLEKQLYELTQKYGFTTSKEKQQRVIEIGKELESVTQLLDEYGN